MSNLFLKIVEKAKATRAADLDLSFLNISDLIALEDLGHNLETLDLSYTNISNISVLQGMNQLKTLSVGYTKVFDISVLRSLNQLKKLDLSNTEVPDISVLFGLNQLKILDLSLTRISDISTLQNLKQLRTLGLRGTKISNISALQSLRQLQTLDLRETNISDISALQNLNQLRTLDLRGTNISSISALKGLSQLQNLYLGTTNISDISVLQGMKNLKILDISNCKSLQDFSVLQGLYQLQTLDLRSTNISNISGLLFLIEKGVPVSLDKGSSEVGIKIYDCPLTTPPVEVVEQGDVEVLAYFKALKKQGVNFLHEAKMLILGEARVGKTTLIRKLENPQCHLPEEYETTRGIDILSLPFEQESGQGFTIHIWDFGGQEIYQATHQFFLTKRSLYILVDDSSRDDTRLPYWLEKIATFSDHSPVILVQNQKADRQKSLNWKDLSNSFEDIRTPLHQFNFSLTKPGDHEGLDRLIIRIRQEIQELELGGIALPKQWVQVRWALQDLEKVKPFIQLHEYFELCAENGIKEKDKALELSTHLHNLGIFLHFQEDLALKHYIILQNEWVTQAVYTIHDNPQTTERKGRFFQADAPEIWHQPAYENMHDILIHLMCMFNLCYKLPDTPKKEYLAPNLLPIEKPEYNWQAVDNLRMEYIYQSFMPEGLIGQLIVGMHRFVKNLNTVWRKGVILQLEDSQAEVIESYKRNKITIRANGPQARDLITLIRNQLDSLHASFGAELERNIQKMIPCNCFKCEALEIPYFYKLEALNRRIAAGRKTIECDISFEAVKVVELLDRVFIEGEAPYSIFLAHSPKDNLYVKELNRHLSLLRRSARLTIWNQADILAGEEIDFQIQIALEQANIVILLVSSDLLSDQAYWNQVVEKVMQKHKAGKARVIPVVARSCMWEDSPFGKLQSPNRDNPIAIAKNRDEIWTKIVKEIKRVL